MPLHCAWREIARDQKEQAHEEGLVEAGEQAEEQARKIVPVCTSL
jgi:hypothetical protein